MTMLSVILTACLMVAVTGYTKYHLRRAASILADVENEQAQAQYQLDAVREQRRPVSARMRELDRLLAELNIQVDEAHTELNQILDRNRVLQSKIDSY